MNTHQGIYRYKRLVFGVSSAPAIWQRAMDQILQGLSGVQCYLDDIIITRSNDEQHLTNLDAVMKCLNDAGLKLNQKKCECMKSEVEYCGHKIDGNGCTTQRKKFKQ